VIPLLAPVADKLGIDLVWFGVLLAVNMQTSFMHPPFGFALFFLRSVAPARAYRDKVTGLSMAPVTTGQIYWGAIPFVGIQILMVALVITFPQMVMVYRDDAPKLDPSRVEIPLSPTGGNAGDDLTRAFGGAPPGPATAPDTLAPPAEPGGQPQPAGDMTDLFR
jgi:hypothetical protein